MHTIQEKILNLWESGLSIREVGEKLNLSRNAVAGHLFRMRQMGVKMRQKKPSLKPAPAGKKPIGVKKLVRRLPAPKKPTLEEVTAQFDQTLTGKPVPLMQLKSGSCRYVVSGAVAKDFLFCNEAKWGGSSYCQKHHYICYIPKSSIREQRAKAHDAATKSADPS